MKDLESIPFFSEHQNRYKIDDNLLYHYTNSKAFFKILKDLTLKTSTFKSLNDLNEGNLEILSYLNNSTSQILGEELIKEKCSLICFSRDYTIDNYPFKGYNHPAMWAHYGQNGDGVCIALDKQAFEEKNKNILTKYFYKFDIVKYEPATVGPEPIDMEVDSTEEYIQKNCQFLFFRKHSDWSNETERRLFIMGYKGKLSIDGCIKYIVLGHKFIQRKNKLRKLFKKIAMDKRSASYHKFSVRSFATFSNNIDGYFFFSAENKLNTYLEEEIKQNLTEYNEYQNWQGTIDNYDEESLRDYL